MRGELREQCELWLAGTELFSPDLIDLARFLGKLAFIPTSERQIEAQHAKTHKRGLGRHNHGEVFQSYGLRIPELTKALDSSPSLFGDFCRWCSVSSNAKKACDAVGLGDHPAIEECHQDRNMFRSPIFGKVVYHADGYSLYRATPFQAQLGPGDDDDDGDDGDSPDVGPPRKSGVLHGDGGSGSSSGGVGSSGGHPGFSGWSGSSGGGGAPVGGASSSSTGQPSAAGQKQSSISASTSSVSILPSSAGQSGGSGDRGNGDDNGGNGDRPGDKGAGSGDGHGDEESNKKKS